MVSEIFSGLFTEQVKSAVDNWDPRHDPVPIDSWLIGWSLYCGEALSESMYSIVRSKLILVLKVCTIGLSCKPHIQVFQHRSVMRATHTSIPT